MVSPRYLLILPIIAYLVTIFYESSGLDYYLLSSTSWLAVAVILFLKIGTETFRSWHDRSVMWLAAIIAIVQVVLVMDMGLFFGFGTNMASLSIYGFMTNTVFLVSKLLGMEISRTFFMKSFGIKRPVLTLAAVSILFTIMYLPTSVWADLIAISTPLTIVDRLGGMVVPVLAQNALASYLSLLGGPLGSIAYIGPIVAYELYLPILPLTPWAFKTLLGVLVPFLGFVSIERVETPQMLRKLGIKLRAPPLVARRQSKSERKSSYYWSSVMIVGILLVWFSTGLLGVFPTIPISGSMRPAMDVGDVAIVVKVSPLDMRVGDIIQYSLEGVPVLHRIISIHDSGGGLEFTTKGDANADPDPKPVPQQYVQGKVVSIIPKVGWVTIYLRGAYFSVFNVIVANLYSSLLLIGLTGSGIFAFYFYARRRTTRVKRRGYA